MEISTIYAWDIIVGAIDYATLMAPFMVIPQPFGMLIFDYIVVEAVVKNPNVVLNVAIQIGWGLVGDVIETIRKFPRVFLGKPTDTEVRMYGKHLTGTTRVRHRQANGISINPHG